MAGFLNPKESARTTGARPPHVNTATGNDRWYSDVLKTRPKAQDLNAIMAQFRTALAFYGLANIEGDDTALQRIISTAAPRKLTGDTTVYIRKDGDDSNDGSADNPASAFATIQRVFDLAATLNYDGHTLTGRCGPGTWTAGGALPSRLSNGLFQLIGDEGTPANCTISTVGDCFLAGGFANLRISGFKLLSSAGSGIHGVQGAYVSILGPMEYGACAVDQIVMQHGAIVEFTSPATVSGGAVSHLHLCGNSVARFTPLALALSGIPAFSGAFVILENSSSAGVTSPASPVTLKPWSSFSGSAGGKRFIIDRSSTLFVPAGTDLNAYLPGSEYGDDFSASLPEIGKYASGVGLDGTDVVRHFDLGRAAYLNREDIAGGALISASAALTLLPQHYGASVICSATLTATLPAAAECAQDWFCNIKARPGATVTVQRAGSDTIDNAASITIAAGTGGCVRKTGAASFEGFV